MDERILERLPKNDDSLNKVIEPAQSALKGLDTGLMSFVDDLELLAGKGLGKAGANVLASRLMDDAIGHRKLMTNSNELYAKRDPKSNKLGELIGEIAGYYAVGRSLGAVASGGSKVLRSANFPAAANKLKILGKSLDNGGVSDNTAAGLLGGAMVGGAAGAIKNPDDLSKVGKDALMGAAGPFIYRNVIQASKTPLASTPKGAVEEGPLSLYRRHGYNVAPSMDPDSGVLKRFLNGFSGKIQTEQHLSHANQKVTNELARRAIGLAKNINITPKELRAIRKDLFTGGYGPVKDIGGVVTDKLYKADLNNISKLYRNSTNSFPLMGGHPVKALTDSMSVSKFVAGDALDAIRRLRADASKSFANSDNAMGRAQLEISRALESQLERALERKGTEAEAVLEGYRNARKGIAKTHAVEEALNPSSGNISAPKLGALLKRGAPLSDELKVIADFANTYPKVSAHQVAPLAYSPLDFAFGSTSLKALALASGRPLARKYIMASGSKIPKSVKPMSPSETVAAQVLLPSLGQHLIPESTMPKKKNNRQAPGQKHKPAEREDRWRKPLDDLRKRNEARLKEKSEEDNGK